MRVSTYSKPMIIVKANDLSTNISFRNQNSVIFDLNLYFLLSQINLEGCQTQQNIKNNKKELLLSLKVTRTTQKKIQ